jgi:DNA helicase IV
MPHPDLAAEQAHVDHAYERLEAMRSAAAEMLRTAFGERGGTFQAVTERDIRVRTSLNRLEQLQLGREALVFGRIDRRGGETRPEGHGDGAGDRDGLEGGEGGVGGVGGVGGSDGHGAGAGAGAGGGEEAFHIGRLAVSDRDQEPVVVDWRAPVAEPFYRATGAHPMGLTRRRHFMTDGRRVIDLEDELFGEGEESGGGRLGLGLSGSAVLLAALERSRTGRMRDIVATVQREQDEVIRGPLGGILVVQGGPGTGKTAVALHRAAYLLYTHRFPLERQGVLVVGPNPLFLRYIGQVLPSLGETGVELSTVGGLYPASATGTDDRETARLKGDARMARFLANAVVDRERPLSRRVEVPYGRFLLRLSTKASADIVAAGRRRAGTHNARRRYVETLLWRELHRLYVAAQARSAGPEDRDAGPFGAESFSESGSESVGESVGESVTDSVGESADDEAATVAPPEELSPAELGRELRLQPRVAEALDRMWPLLTPEQLLHDLFGARPLIELASRGLFGADEQARLYRPRSSSAGQVSWTPADLALLDEARELLGPTKRRSRSAASPGGDIRSYGHIVVDEAQDLSPMQLRMLGRRSLSGSMTIVGDIAQATGEWAPASWPEVLAHLPAHRGTRVVELTVNYRTPSEIMALASRVLRAAAPQMVPPESVRPAGFAPRVVAACGEGGGGLEDLAARITAEEVAVISGESASGGSVAVITAPSLVPALTAAFTRAGIPFGTAAYGALEDTVTLVAVEAVKGLEFDSVVVVEPSAIVAEGAQGLRSLYVALTRATRRLAVLHAAPLPEALVD